MTEQLFVYWLLWATLIIVTFFMQKNFSQLFYKFILLLMIISAEYYVQFFGIKIYCPLILVTVLSFYLLGSQQWKSAYYIITILLIFIALTILIWQLVAPIWFVLKIDFLLPLILVFTSSILLEGIIERMTVILMAMSVSNILYGIILLSYHLYDTIGEPIIIIQIVYSIVMVCCVHAFKGIINFIKVFFRRFTI